MSKTCAVTGGLGFIGSYLVKALVKCGWRVIVIDNLTRGSTSRLNSVIDKVILKHCDVRVEDEVFSALIGCEVVFHLAAINGTENFYKHPELVLDVGIRGALSVVNACRRAGVPDLVVASSAEVYQTPYEVPTSEDVSLMLPNTSNPRYSYGGSKIATELIAFNYAREHFRKLQIFRPHNVYGPDMGWKHVIPQFILRALDLMDSQSLQFPIHGTGKETRAFAYIDDVVDGILCMYENGVHREIYHIGNEQEISVGQLVNEIVDLLGIACEIIPGPANEGSTVRRCPNLSKMQKIGYRPKISLRDGLSITTDWYKNHRDLNSSNELM